MAQQMPSQVSEGRLKRTRSNARASDATLRTCNETQVTQVQSWPAAKAAASAVAGRPAARELLAAARALSDEIGDGISAITQALSGGRGRDVSAESQEGVR